MKQVKAYNGKAMKYLFLTIILLTGCGSIQTKQADVSGLWIEPYSRSTLDLTSIDTAANSDSTIVFTFHDGRDFVQCEISALISGDDQLGGISVLNQVQVAPPSADGAPCVWLEQLTAYEVNGDRLTIHWAAGLKTQNFTKSN